MLCLITMPLTLVEILYMTWQFGDHPAACPAAALLQVQRTHTTYGHTTTSNMHRNSREQRERPSFFYPFHPQGTSIFVSTLSITAIALDRRRLIVCPHKSPWGLPAVLVRVRERKFGSLLNSSSLL